MSIDDILKTSLHPNVANTTRIEANQPHTKTEKDGRFVQAKFDSVDISKEARKLEQTIMSLKTGVKEMPDVRAAKTEEIKAKLKGGFYDRPEVIEQVAKKIIDVFSIKKQES